MEEKTEQLYPIAFDDSRFVDSLVDFLRKKRHLMDGIPGGAETPIELRISVSGEQFRLQVERVGRDYVAGKDAIGNERNIPLSQIIDWRDVTKIRKPKPPVTQESPKNEIQGEASIQKEKEPYRPGNF